MPTTQSTPDNLWNSLEIAKLLVGLLSPIAVLGLGFWINRMLKRVEHSQWVNQKVIERRLSVFDQLAPIINDMLCYFTFIGCWKDHTPPDIVKMKRDSDKLVYVNAPLFPSGLIEIYNNFISTCFSTYSGWGSDAKLKTAIERRREAAKATWKDDWNSYFDEKAPTNVENVRIAYQELMTYMAEEIGVSMNTGSVRSGKAPGNIR